MELIMFSKMLQEFDVSGAGDIIKGLGFDGVDLTCRPGGHVLPENVTTDLPPAVATLRDRGLSVPMLTTGILSAEEPHAEDIFRMAAECQVPALKLGYHQYRAFGTIQDLIAEVRAELGGLAKLAQQYGVSANLHIHSGNYVTALAPILYILVKDFDREHVGAYVDPGHMYNEGGLSGWKIGIDILSPWINLVAAKSMGWVCQENEDGTVAWHNKMFPIKQGMVQWPQVFECLKAIGYDGPVSLHSEYQGGHSWRDLTTQELIAQTREDIEYIKGVVRDVYGT
ncbi:MAG: sugar phosphate isomerase/epimerase family protein [Armatimonadota bacterium]